MHLKFSFHSLRILLICALVSCVQARLPAATPTTITLEPSTAHGGVIVTTSDGRKAVSLPNSTQPTKGYKWQLATPLAAGWWEVSVDFAPQPKDSLRLKLFFGSALQSVLDLSEIELPSQTASFQFYYYCAGPVTFLEVRPQRLMNEAIRGISRVQLRRSEKAAPAGLRLVVETAVNRTGTANLPADLPGGNWQILPHFTAPQPEPSGVVSVRTKATTRINAANSGTINFFTDTSPQSLLWEPAAGNIDGAVLRFIPPYKPTIPLGTDRKPMPVFEVGRATRTELTLTYGASTSGGPAPAFTQLPNDAKLAVVTSWDDSPKVADLRVASLLEKHGFRGTFFTTQGASNQKDYLSELERRGMEVASHTLNHPRGWLITPTQWALECLQMRVNLEEAIGHPVISFAYPYNYLRSDDTEGDYVLRGVREAGYLSARTTLNAAGSIDAIPDLLRLSTDGHFRSTQLNETWARAKTKPGAIFYFWGHAWEIDTEQKWSEFEAMLIRYAHEPGTWYATQGQLALWKTLREQAHWETAPHNGTTQRVSVTYPKLVSFFQSQIPLTIRLPDGVTQAQLADGRNLSITRGVVTLPNETL